MTFSGVNELFRYQTNLFEKGRKVFSREEEMSEHDLIMHTGRANREAFLSLINRWNRNGMIGFENHGKTYLYVAM